MRDSRQKNEPDGDGIMTQLSMDRAVQARDTAMGVVDENADAEWKDEALHAVYETAAVRPTFTADDVWERIPTWVWTHTPAALGPIMRRAAKKGWIEATDRFKNSARVSRHAAPIRIWRSLLR